MGWVIGGIAVVVVVGVVVLISRHSQVEEQAREQYRKPTPPMPEQVERCDERLGAPVFISGQPGKASLLVNPHGNEEVWCVTPYGVFNGTVTNASQNVLRIDTPDYTVTAEFCRNYLSSAMADKLSLSAKSAYIVTDVRGKAWSSETKSYAKGGGRKYRPTINQRQSSVWVRDYTIFGDFLELMVEELWFELMFGGFLEPVEYYDELDPIRDTEDGDVINWETAEEQQSDFEVMKEQVEAAAAEAAATGEAIMTAEQNPGPFEDSSQSFIGQVPITPATPEASPAPIDDSPTKHYSAPEPSYDPPSYGGGGGGGGYDSGDSGGGGDD